MRVVTFNVNGINARLPNLLRWLGETAPDGGMYTNRSDGSMTPSFESRCAKRLHA
jgi:hypothetical protein